MARMGFNVVRLGMTWSGLEPGTASANDPAICARGAPQPDQFNQAVLNRYVGHLRTTIDLLARFHIYTILDMHQDVYSETFEGEGAPDWAVCTNGVASDGPARPLVPRLTAPKRQALPSATSGGTTSWAICRASTTRCGAMWRTRSARTPGSLGFDPFNEPFSTALVHFHGEHFDAELECFYTGRAHMGTALHGAPPLRCPTNDPAQGVIPTIEASDPACAGLRRAGQLR